MDDDATQPSTQPMFDPRRVGRNNSGLTHDDLSDVICILHPSSTAAVKCVGLLAKTAPQHILQNDDLDDSGQPDYERHRELQLDGAPRDIALRMSSKVVNSPLGFCFGRNRTKCDIMFSANEEKNQHRISNLHFRIWVTRDGVIMLQDLSTNGTLVDGQVLRGKPPRPRGAPPIRPKPEDSQRMLVAGSFIELINPDQSENIRFIVRIPSRTGEDQRYYQRLHDYHNSLDLEQAQQADHRDDPRLRVVFDNTPSPKIARATPLVTTNTRRQSAPIAPHPLPWDGGLKYNVVRTLGSGAFSTVYAVATKVSGQTYAAKEISKRQLIKDGATGAKIHNEMAIMKKVNHPNIVPMVDYEETPSKLYIVMDLVQYGDMTHYLQERGTISEAQGKSLTRQMLSALHYLHRNGIIHRDIKPDNLLVKSLDPIEIQISDFGLSKIAKQEGESQSFIKTFCGTLLYCAPEVYPDYAQYILKEPRKRTRQGQSKEPTKKHVYDHACDMWSMATVLHMLLTKMPAWKAANQQEMLRAITQIPLEPTHLRRQRVSELGIRFIGRILTPHPAERPTELQCLTDEWLDEGNDLSQYLTVGADIGVVLDSDQNSLSVSQFSLNEGLSESSNDDDLSLTEQVARELRKSKRSRTDLLIQPRLPVPEIPSSGEDTEMTLSTVFPDPGESYAFMKPENLDHQPRPRLFGEITSSAIGSSGVFGQDHLNLETPRQVSFADGSNTMQPDHTAYNFTANPISTTAEQSSDINANSLHIPIVLDELVAAPSLLGAESLVGRLKVGSVSPRQQSPVPTPDSPLTPATPSAQNASLTASSVNNELDRSSIPNQTGSIAAASTIFSRRIELDLPASYYFTDDPATHNLEYARKASGNSNISHYPVKQRRPASPWEEDSVRKDELQEYDVTIDGIRYTGSEEHLESSMLVTKIGPSRHNTEAERMDVEAGQPSRPVSKLELSQAASEASTIIREPLGVEREAQSFPVDFFSHAVKDTATMLPPTTIEMAVPSSTMSQGFRRPRPVLGKLVTSSKSFVHLVWTLNERRNSFGRSLNCTFPYRDSHETRIPKHALIISFWKPGAKESFYVQDKWYEQDGVKAIIKTDRSNGSIYVNGRQLRRVDENGRTEWGYLRSGDVIGVYEGKEKDDNNSGVLSFVCEFLHSDAKSPRKEGELFAVEKSENQFIAN